ncbi:MAG: Tetratricopeptide 2 repeat protein [Bryobacterales bacterium]|nr:Tetratricopeptide 2 repeat protein [Bryobacterales bacterium]
MRAVGALSPKQDYSRENVRRMLTVSERQLRSWEKQGLIAGGAVFTFSDIIALRTLLKLREKRVPSRTIGQAIHSLRSKLSHIERPLSELRISSDGGKIAVHLSGQKMEALTGQLLLNFDAAQIAGPMAFPESTVSRAASWREAEEWFQRGLTLEETGAPAERAIEAYNKALECNPEAAGALVNLGTVYFRSGKLAKAEAFYRKAVAADPQYALAHFNLGNLYDEKGDTARAREHYLAALKLNPKYADAYFNLALVCEQVGDNLKAVSYWNSYLKLDAGSPWAQTARRQLERLKEVTFVGSRSS